MVADNYNKENLITTNKVTPTTFTTETTKATISETFPLFQRQYLLKAMYACIS